MFGVRARARSTNTDLPWPPAPAQDVSFTYPVGAMAAIAYGSLLPFSIDPGAVLSSTPLTALRLPVPTLEDFIVNLLLYVPLGCLIVLYLRRTVLSGVAKATIAVGLSFSLSLSIEWIQVGTAGRVASWFDVLLNTAGGAFGAAMFAGARGVRITTIIRSALGKPSTWVVLLTCGVLLYGLIPFSPVANTQELHSAFARARWDMTQPRVVDPALAPFALLGTELSMAVWFALLGALHSYAGRGCDRRGSVTPAHVVAHGFVLAGLIEILQLFSVAHTFDVAAILLRTIAVAFGAWTARFVITACHERTREDLIVRAFGAFWLTVVLLVMLFSIQMASAPVHTSVTKSESVRMIEWPFLVMWRAPLIAASTRLFEMAFVSCGVIGLFVALFRSVRDDLCNAAVVIGSALCLIMLELSKVAVNGMTLDVTPVVVGVCIAVAAVDLANRLHPRSADIHVSNADVRPPRARP